MHLRLLRGSMREWGMMTIRKVEMVMTMMMTTTKNRSNLKNLKTRNILRTTSTSTSMNITTSTARVRARGRRNTSIRVMSTIMSTSMSISMGKVGNIGMGLLGDLLMGLLLMDLLLMGLLMGLPLMADLIADLLIITLMDPLLLAVPLGTKRVDTRIKVLDLIATTRRMVLMMKNRWMTFSLSRIRRKGVR